MPRWLPWLELDAAHVRAAPGVVPRGLVGHDEWRVRCTRERVFEEPTLFARLVPGNLRALLPVLFHPRIVVTPHATNDEAEVTDRNDSEDPLPPDHGAFRHSGFTITLTVSRTFSP